MYRKDYEEKIKNLEKKLKLLDEKDKSIDKLSKINLKLQNSLELISKQMDKKFLMLNYQILQLIKIIIIH